MSVFGVSLVRKTPNTDAFHAVISYKNLQIWAVSIILLNNFGVIPKIQYITKKINEWIKVHFNGCLCPGTDYSKVISYKAAKFTVGVLKLNKWHETTKGHIASCHSTLFRQLRVTGLWGFWQLRVKGVALWAQGAPPSLECLQ